MESITRMVQCEAQTSLEQGHWGRSSTIQTLSYFELIYTKSINGFKVG